MLKVKDDIVKRFYKSNLNTKDQLIYNSFIFRSDEKGKVSGAYYKEICETIGCSVAQFYISIKKLMNEKLITVSGKKYNYGMDIIITENIFCNHEIRNQFKNFCDLNVEMYETDNYKNLRAGSRRILAYFTFRILKNKEKANKLVYLIDKKTNKSEIHMYEKIKKEVFGDDLTYRMFKDYIEELQDLKFIHIGHKIDVNGKNFDIITVLSKMLEKPSVEVTEKGVVIKKKRSSKYLYCEHFVKGLCRKFKIAYEQLSLTDVSMLLIQYGRITKQGNNTIYSVMKTAFTNYQYDELNGKIFHSLIRKLINKDYDNSLVVY